MDEQKERKFDETKQKKLTQDLSAAYDRFLKFLLHFNKERKLMDKEEEQDANEERERELAHELHVAYDQLLTVVKIYGLRGDDATDTQKEIELVHSILERSDRQMQFIADANFRVAQTKIAEKQLEIAKIQSHISHEQVIVTRRANWILFAAMVFALAQVVVAWFSFQSTRDVISAKSTEGITQKKVVKQGVGEKK